MKKLVFAAIAALVMVSVSNVFANDNNQSSLYTVAPTQPADTTTSTPSVAQ